MFSNGNNSFLQLEDLLLPPPLPGIISLLLVLGTLKLSRWGTRWLPKENRTPLTLAAVFVTTAGLLGAFLHGIAWAGYASISVLKICGWALAALGFFELRPSKVRLAKRVLREYFSKASWTGRFALVISTFTGMALFAAALGPAIDADSLEQHLAVPLDWLRHGGAYPRPDWFTARYVGLGESLNMLGLAVGTDGLGAAFQAAGLIIMCLAVVAFAKTREDQLFAVLLVVACPVIVPLITNQKPQLLPVAGLTVALFILIRRFKSFDRTTAILAFGCAAFAIANKHSFLLTGSVVVFIGLLAAVRARQLPSALVVAACWFAVFAAPVFARNFIFYGDPLSPLLERWRPDPDPALITYTQQSLREFGGPVTLGKLLRLPWDLVVTPRLGLVHEALGIGALGFTIALRERGPTRQLLFAALAASVFIIGLGQPTSRFFLEPYLWCAAAVVALPVHPLKPLLFKALTIQALVVGAVAAYLGVILFPGALTHAQRERVMTLMAAGYAEAKWLAKTLPVDAIVLGEYRYRALLPRPFVVGDRLLLTDDNEPVWKQRLTEFVRKKQVTVLVTRYPPENTRYRWLATRYGTPLAGPVKFREAARSPLNRGNVSEWIAMRIKLTGSSS